MNRKLIKDLMDAIKASDRKKTSGYDTSAVVRRIEDGTAWVHIPGGVDETPVKLTINASVGDTVQVRVSGGRAFLVGNRTAPPTDDTTAIKATYVAKNAQETAVEAKSEASEAWHYAGTAKEAAESAQDSADSAAEAAIEAWNHADDAHQAAVSANNSANNALVQLSVVEDVAGTLRWISEHGSYVPTTDTTVIEGSVYFIYENGDYIPIANPDPSANPSQEGWYVLDVTESQAKYIMAHLAVTSAGLWVLPVNQMAEHPLVDSDGDQIIDSDDNPIVDFSEDPQHASGYKVLLSGGTNDPNFPIGLSIYNDEGEMIANYGETTTIGNALLRNVYIDSNAVYIRDGETVLASYGSTTKFYEPDGETEAAEIGANGMHIKSGLIGGWDINTDSLSRTAVPVSASHFESGTITLDSLGMDIHGVYPSGADFTTSDLDINPEYIKLTTFNGSTKWYETEVGQGSISVVNFPNTAYSSYVTMGSGSLSVSDYVESNIIRADTNHDLQLQADFNSVCVRLTQYGNFRPEGVGTQSLGTQNNPWKDVWANDTSINTSDRKFKDDVEDITFSEDLIMNLKPVTYMWKDGDHRRKRMGFVAQDVADVCEKIGENLSVVTASYSDGSEYYGEKADDENLRWGMSYEQLIAPMVC